MGNSFSSPLRKSRHKKATRASFTLESKVRNVQQGKSRKQQQPKDNWRRGQNVRYVCEESEGKTDCGSNSCSSSSGGDVLCSGESSSPNHCCFTETESSLTATAEIETQQQQQQQQQQKQQQQQQEDALFCGDVAEADDNDECWLTQNTALKLPVSKSEQHRDSLATNEQALIQQPQVQQGFDNQQSKQCYSNGEHFLSQASNHCDSSIQYPNYDCQQQMRQNYATGENVSGAYPSLCNGAIHYQQQTKQQLQREQQSLAPAHPQQIYSVPAAPNLASAIPVPTVEQHVAEISAQTAARQGSGVAIYGEKPSAAEETTVRRTVYVPQNWTSIISFVHGTDMEAIMRQCRADITVSCCSVECSRREKDTLGTVRKRAVHICAKRNEDISAAIKELMVSMPVLMSQPDLPERSWLIAAPSDNETGREDQQEQKQQQPPPPSQLSKQPSLPQNVGGGAAAIASGDYSGIEASGNEGGGVGNTAETMTAEQPYSTESRCNSVSRRQLNETRPVILEVDVENSSAGLLPFFPGSCDRRGAVVSARSGCSIEITDRLRRRPNGEERRIIRVQAPNMSALEKCARLLDLHFPSMGARAQFRELRERTDSRAKHLRFA